MGIKVKTQSKKVNKAWLNQHVNDPYVRLAQKEGFRARAAYKLKEIDETLGLIRPGDVVVDLGSAPGAWSQYVRRRLSPQGAAVGELRAASLPWTCCPWSRSRACSSSRAISAKRPCWRSWSRR
jgi:23S rRNA (uridine2552-2'-O)-methyltransferase